MKEREERRLEGEREEEEDRERVNRCEGKREGEVRGRTQEKRRNGERVRECME